jgi:hypothetical protein
LRDLKKTVSVVHAIYSAPKDICKQNKKRREGGREAEEAIRKKKEQPPRDKKRRESQLYRAKDLWIQFLVLVSLSSS